MVLLSFISTTIGYRFVYNSKAVFNLFLTMLNWFMIYSVKCRDTGIFHLNKVK